MANLYGMGGLGAPSFGPAGGLVSDPAGIGIAVAYLSRDETKNWARHRLK